MDENDVVDELGTGLQRNWRRVFIRENSANHRAFKEALREHFGYLPVLNEIHMEAPRWHTALQGSQGHGCS